MLYLEVPMIFVNTIIDLNKNSLESGTLVI